MSQKLPSIDHHNFTELAPTVGAGDAPNNDWCALTDVPLAILVGVTGVGKSTTLQTLRQQQLPFTLLPDRRELTDHLIIAYLQRQDGITPYPVVDRTERFRLTRRYREQFAGGMSHALSQLLVRPSQRHNHVQSDSAQSDSTQWWLFDGLRGANEVEAAITLLPQARFIVLDAPDAVRVQRLLGRADQFDRVALQAMDLMASTHEQTFAALGIPEADTLFNAEESAWLLSLCAPPIGNGSVAPDDLRARLKIVTEERRNYDPTAAMRILQQQAMQRSLLLDTTSVDPTEAASRIIRWLSS